MLTVDLPCSVTLPIYKEIPRISFWSLGHLAPGHKTALALSCRVFVAVPQEPFQTRLQQHFWTVQGWRYYNNLCAGFFTFVWMAGERRNICTPQSNSCLYFLYSDDDLIPYDMSEDRELKTKAPVYIRDCIEGRRFETESLSVSYWFWVGDLDVGLYFQS